MHPRNMQNTTSAVYAIPDLLKYQNYSVFLLVEINYTEGRKAETIVCHFFVTQYIILPKLPRKRYDITILPRVYEIVRH